MYAPSSHFPSDHCENNEMNHLQLTFPMWWNAGTNLRNAWCKVIFRQFQRDMVCHLEMSNDFSEDGRTKIISLDIQDDRNNEQAKLIMIHKNNSSSNLPLHTKFNGLSVCVVAMMLFTDWFNGDRISIRNGWLIKMVICLYHFGRSLAYNCPSLIATGINATPKIHLIALYKMAVLPHQHKRCQSYRRERQRDVHNEKMAQFQAQNNAKKINDFNFSICVCVRECFLSFLANDAVPYSFSQSQIAEYFLLFFFFFCLVWWIIKIGLNPHS